MTIRTKTNKTWYETLYHDDGEPRKYVLRPRYTCEQVRGIKVGNMKKEFKKRETLAKAKIMAKRDPKWIKYLTELREAGKRIRKEILELDGTYDELIDFRICLPKEPKRRKSSGTV